MRRYDRATPLVRRGNERAKRGVGGARFLGREFTQAARDFGGCRGIVQRAAADKHAEQHACRAKGWGDGDGGGRHRGRAEKWAGGRNWAFFLLLQGMSTTIQPPAGLLASSEALDAVPKTWSVLGSRDGGQQWTLLATYTYATPAEASAALALELAQTFPAFERFRFVVRETFGSARAALFGLSLRGRVVTRDAGVVEAFRGPQGPAGIVVGTTGFTGALGAQGLAGPSLTLEELRALFAGAAGAAGPTGTDGDAGLAGADAVGLSNMGPIGTDGPAGPPSTSLGGLGYLGATGSGGDVGDIGPASFVEGDPGAVGAAGDVGALGARGDRGAAGPASLVEGDLGAAGPVGPAGFVGDVGAASLVAGDTGDRGAASLVAGDTGDRGAASLVAGASGAAGAAGSRGFSGFPGEVGVLGDAGAAGDAGPMPVDLAIWIGPVGAAGDAGADGVALPGGGVGGAATGPTGADSLEMGPTGDLGALSGLTPAGPAGMTGWDGPAGAGGDAMLAAAAGPVGWDGPTGSAAAATADTGAMGWNGPAGAYVVPQAAYGFVVAAASLAATGAAGWHTASPNVAGGLCAAPAVGPVASWTPGVDAPLSATTTPAALGLLAGNYLARLAFGGLTSVTATGDTSAAAWQSLTVTPLAPAGHAFAQNNPAYRFASPTGGTERVHNSDGPRTATCCDGGPLSGAGLLLQLTDADITAGTGQFGFAVDAVLTGGADTGGTETLAVNTLQCILTRIL